MIVGDAPNNIIPAPKLALPCSMEKPITFELRPSPPWKVITVPALLPSMTVREGPLSLRRAIAFPWKSRRSK